MTFRYLIATTSCLVGALTSMAHPATHGQTLACVLRGSGGVGFAAWLWVASVLLPLPALHAATVYIHTSAAWQISSWRYWKGNAEPPASWRDLAFDDSAWLTGKAPFGYGLRGHV